MDLDIAVDGDASCSNVIGCLLEVMYFLLFVIVLMNIWLLILMGGGRLHLEIYKFTSVSILVASSAVDVNSTDGTFIFLMVLWQ